MVVVVFGDSWIGVSWVGTSCEGVSGGCFVGGCGAGSCGLGCTMLPAHEQSRARISLLVSGFPSLQTLHGFCCPKGTPAQSRQLSNAESVGKRHAPH